MNIQLNYQGQLYDIPFDENATFQFLYQYVQNQLQCQVQLFYTLPDQSQGEVNPAWPIAQLVQAGAKFFVNPIQQGGNIMINIFLEDQQCTQFNANSQQTLKEMLDYVNSNMLKQYQESELFDQYGNELTNKLTDTFGQFPPTAQPFLLFIPKCQSGIQNFVQQVEPQQIAPSQQQVVDIYYQNQKQTKVCEHQETMQEILNFVNENTGQQDTTFELYDAQGNKLSNNLYDKFSYYVQDKQPLQFYVPKLELQNDGLNLSQNENLKERQSQEIQLQIYVDSNINQELLVKPNQQLSEIVNDISEQVGMQISSFELQSQKRNKLSENLEDKFGNYRQEQQPLVLNLNYTQYIQLQVYLNSERISDMQVSQNQSIQEILSNIGQQKNQIYTKFEILDNKGCLLTKNNPSQTFSKLNLSDQPIQLYISSNDQQLKFLQTEIISQKTQQNEYKPSQDQELYTSVTNQSEAFYFQTQQILPSNSEDSIKMSPQNSNPLNEVKDPLSKNQLLSPPMIQSSNQTMQPQINLQNNQTFSQSQPKSTDLPQQSQPRSMDLLQQSQSRQTDQLQQNKIQMPILQPSQNPPTNQAQQNLQSMRPQSNFQINLQQQQMPNSIELKTPQVPPLASPFSKEVNQQQKLTPQVIPKPNTIPISNPIEKPIPTSSPASIPYPIPIPKPISQNNSTMQPAPYKPLGNQQVIINPKLSEPPNQQQPQISVPIQPTRPISSKMPIPTMPIPNPMPVPSTRPIPSTMPIQPTRPIPSTMPVPSTMPIPSARPIPSTIPIPSPMPIPQPNQSTFLPQTSASLIQPLNTQSVTYNFNAFDDLVRKTIQTSNYNNQQYCDIDKMFSLQDSFKVLPNFNLFFDTNGNFVIYKFHSQIVQGILKKENSRKSIKIPNQLDWKKCNNISYAQLGDYGFVVEWNNQNVSSVRITFESDSAIDDNIQIHM